MNRRYVVQGRKIGKEKWFDCHQDPKCLNSVTTPYVEAFPDGSQGFPTFTSAAEAMDRLNSQHSGTHEYRTVRILA